MDYVVIEAFAAIAQDVPIPPTMDIDFDASERGQVFFVDLIAGLLAVGTACLAYFNNIIVKCARAGDRVTRFETSVWAHKVMA